MTDGPRSLLFWGALVFGALALGSGCFSPATTRVPNIVAGNNQIERQAAQTKDPYPSRILGPETGFRPLNYQQSRSEARLAKDTFFTWVRPRFDLGVGIPAPVGMTTPPWISRTASPAVLPAPWTAGPPVGYVYGVPGQPPQMYPPSPLPWGPGMVAPPVAVTPGLPYY